MIHSWHKVVWWNTFRISLLSMVTLKSVFNIYRFKQQIITRGYVAKDGKAHCISPLLYETGFIPFEVSTDNELTFPYSGTWLSGYLLKSTAPFFFLYSSSMVARLYKPFPFDQFSSSLTGLRKVSLAGLMLIHLLRDELSQQLSSSSSINS